MGAVLVVVIPIGFAVAALGSFADDISLTGEGPDPAPDGGPDGGPVPREDVEVTVPDLDGLSGVDAELGQVLVDIDRSERTMMATQAGFVEVLGGIAGPGTEEDLEAALAEVSEVAGEGQRELQTIRRDLTDASASASVVRDLRERYLSHLDAWVRYLIAIEDDPRVLVGGADEGYTLSIDTTGDAFANVIREDLPDELDEDVRAFADAIVARGFPEGRTSSGDSV